MTSSDDPIVEHLKKIEADLKRDRAIDRFERTIETAKSLAPYFFVAVIVFLLFFVL